MKLIIFVSLLLVVGSAFCFDLSIQDRIDEKLKVFETETHECVDFWKREIKPLIVGAMGNSSEWIDTYFQKRYFDLNLSGSFSFELGVDDVSRKIFDFPKKCRNRILRYVFDRDQCDPDYHFQKTEFFSPADVDRIDVDIGGIVQQVTIDWMKYYTRIGYKPDTDDWNAEFRYFRVNLIFHYRHENEN